jgi:hypothetical protein
MARILLVALAALAITGVAPASSTRVQAPRMLALKGGDRFTLANSTIACIVAKTSLTIRCFKQASGAGYRQADGTSALLESEGSLQIERQSSGGHRAVLVAGRQPAASRPPAVVHAARPLIGGVGLLHRGDGAYVTGTHIVCVDSSAPPALTCGSLSGEGLATGSYFARLSDSAIAVARVRSNNDFKTVFQAKQ